MRLRINVSPSGTLASFHIHGEGETLISLDSTLGDRPVYKIVKPNGSTSTAHSMDDALKALFSKALRRGKQERQAA